jgi:hypothetical protein
VAGLYLLAFRARYPRACLVSLAVWRFAHLPKWLAGLFAVCAAIPGPFDELAAGLAVAAFIAWKLRTALGRRRAARMVRFAWEAGATR